MTAAVFHGPRFKAASVGGLFHVRLGIAQRAPSSPRRLGRCVGQFICDTDKNGLEGQARRLFGSSGAGCRRRRRLTGHGQVYVVDIEYGWLPLRVSPRRKGSRKFIAVLKV